MNNYPWAYSICVWDVKVHLTCMVKQGSCGFHLINVRFRCRSMDDSNFIYILLYSDVRTFDRCWHYTVSCAVSLHWVYIKSYGYRFVSQWRCEINRASTLSCIFHYIVLHFETFGSLSCIDEKLRIIICTNKARGQMLRHDWICDCL